MRFAIGRLVVLWNGVPISSRLWDIAL